MLLKDILARKPVEIHTIGPEASLDDAVGDFVKFNIGSLLVTNRRRFVGIITERDVLRVQASHRGALRMLRVGDYMITKVVTATPADTIEAVMRLMTMHRVRHLPILLNNRLYGIVSIGDVVKAQYEQLESDNHFMRSYIQGEGAEVATPVA